MEQVNKIRNFKHKSKKNIAVLYSFAVLLSISSCSVVSYFTGIPEDNYDQDTYLSTFDEVEGGVSSHININGYYNFKLINCYYTDIEGGIIFFDDGSFSTLQWKDAPPLLLNVPNVSLKSQLTDYDYRYKLMGRVFKRKYYDLSGGLYVVRGDTILTEHITNDLEHYNYIERMTFKIIDRNTLQLLQCEKLTRNGNSCRDFRNMHPDITLLHFYPAYNLPEPTNMYMKSLWHRWKDVDKWRDYMRQRDLYLKNNRK